MESRQNRAILIAEALLVLLGVVAGVGMLVGEPDQTGPSPLATPGPASYRSLLPIVAGGRGAADLAIYDCQGQPTDTDWLAETFGAVSWTQSPTVTVTALRACCGHGCPAVIVAHVEDEHGEPVEGAMVSFGWAGGPMLPLERWGCGDLRRGVYGPTNAAGDIGFGLGGGAYYQPPNSGPHQVWIGPACVKGLGMLAFTDHYHVDVGFMLPGGCCANAAVFDDWGFSPDADVTWLGELAVVWPSEGEGP